MSFKLTSTYAVQQTCQQTTTEEYQPLICIWAPHRRHLKTQESVQIRVLINLWFSQVHVGLTLKSQKGRDINDGARQDGVAARSKQEWLRTSFTRAKRCLSCVLMWRILIRRRFPGQLTQTLLTANDFVKLRADGMTWKKWLQIWKNKVRRQSEESYCCTPQGFSVER